MRFFIPHLRGNSTAAEAEWRRYLKSTNAPPDAKRVYSVTYEKEGSKLVVTVDERRLEFKRRTGPRGGRIKDAGYSSHGQRTGTLVSGIVDRGDVLEVWSYGPPFGGWANPSLIGPSTITAIEYFE